MTQWEYNISQLKIDHNAEDCKPTELCLQYMNDLGKEGWEVFNIASAVMGMIEYVTYTCRRTL